MDGGIPSLLYIGCAGPPPLKRSIMRTSHRERTMVVLSFLLGAAVFGCSSFRAVRKNWSLPMALLLSVVAGVVSCLAIGMVVKASDKALREKERNDKNGNT